MVKRKLHPLVEDGISSVQKTASSLMDMSWAESFFGNISLLINLDIKGEDPVQTFPLPLEAPSLSGRSILVTRTFSTMKDVVKDPVNSLGLFRLKSSGMDLMWGSSPPTSELSSHLAAYMTGNGRAIVHCHTDAVDRVSKLFPDGPPLPPGYCWLRELPPGSMELARATGEALKMCDTVIWKGHGPLSLGEDLYKCMGRLVRLDAYLRELLEE